MTGDARNVFSNLAKSNCTRARQNSDVHVSHESYIFFSSDAARGDPGADLAAFLFYSDRTLPCIFLSRARGDEFCGCFVHLKRAGHTYAPSYLLFREALFSRRWLFSGPGEQREVVPACAHPKKAR